MKGLNIGQRYLPFNLHSRLWNTFHKTKEEVNNNCSKNDSSSLAGYFCLLRVKNNGWSIPDDVWNLKI